MVYFLYDIFLTISKFFDFLRFRRLLWVANKNLTRQKLLAMHAFVQEVLSFWRTLWVAHKTLARQTLLAMKAFS